VHVGDIYSFNEFAKRFEPFP